MKITNKLKVVLKSILSLKMGEIVTDKAVLKWDGEEDLKEGMEVFIVDENDEFIPAPDGEYVAEDEKVIVVEDGIVKEIRDPKAEVSSDEGEGEAEGEGEGEGETEPVVEEEETPAPADEPETEEPKAEEEDRIANLEARVEELVAALNEIVNALAALEGRIAEVEGKLSKVEGPATDPIAEEPQVEEKKSSLSYVRRKN